LPRFSAAAKENGVRPILGAELTLEDGTILPVLIESRAGYQNLCRLLTRSHLRDVKGQSKIQWSELPEFSAGLIALTGDQEGPLIDSIRSPKRRDPARVLGMLGDIFGHNRLFVEIQRHYLRGEEKINGALVELAAKYSLPILATNGVLYAKPYGRQIADVFTCVRHHTHLDAAGRLLTPNSERFLKSASTIEALFRDLPEAIANTERLADHLRFSLEDLGYEFPRYPVGPGETMAGVLRE
jgi:error-prone DNA polymerase